MPSGERRSRRPAAVAAVVVAALLAGLVAACGGPGEDGQPEKPRRAARILPARLALDPDPPVAGGRMRIIGCGFRAGLPVSGEDHGPSGIEPWSATADGTGCITVDRRASLEAGNHRLRSYQLSKRSRRTLMAELQFTVDPRPLAIVSEDNHFQWEPEKGCLGLDDRGDFSAAGSLEAGESFRFTPRYPGCDSQRAVMVQLTSGDPDARLELSTQVPAADGISGNPGQRGQTIAVPAEEGSARLCMFPNLAHGPPANYTITVRNVGDSAADVTLTGKDRNDWPVFYWEECLDADADRDGWSDSHEHAMAQLVHPASSRAPGKAPAGSDYLRSCGTPAPDDELDPWPVDLDDDGVVTEADVALVAARAGQGNGVAWANIVPVPGDPAGHWSHVGEWNRFDLNADGRVDDADADLVRNEVGARCP